MSKWHQDALAVGSKCSRKASVLLWRCYCFTSGLSHRVFPDASQCLFGGHYLCCARPSQTRLRHAISPGSRLCLAKKAGHQPAVLHPALWVYIRAVCDSCYELACTHDHMYMFRSPLGQKRGANRSWCLSEPSDLSFLSFFLTEVVEYAMGGRSKRKMEKRNESVKSKVIFWPIYCRQTRQKSQTQLAQWCMISAKPVASSFLFSSTLVRHIQTCQALPCCRLESIITAAKPTGNAVITSRLQW